MTWQSDMLYNHRMRKFIILLAVVFLAASCSSTGSLKDPIASIWNKIKPFKDDKEISKRLDALEEEAGSDKGTTLSASGHPDYPPVMWQEGDYIAGVGTEVLKLALEELSIGVDSIFQGSWRQVLERATDGQIDAVVGVYITEERKKAFEFSAPYMKDPVVIFVAKGNSFPYAKYEDLIGKRGARTVGDSFGPEFDKFIVRKLAVTSAFTVEDNFDRLLSGEADYFVCSMQLGLLEADRLGITHKIEYLPTNVVSENLYIAISKNSKYVKYMPEINKKIEALIKDGAIDKLIEEKRTAYLEPFRRGR